MKILCFVNHFYGTSNNFIGGSTHQDEQRINKRRQYVLNTIESLRTLGLSIEVVVCGINGKSLVPIDISFDYIQDRPIELIYESLNKFKDFIEKYDYFINIEDDIILSKESFDKIVSLSNLIKINEAILPNRLEYDKLGRAYCVDLYAIPSWREEEKILGENIFRVPENPHSGILILSKDRMKYTLDRINPTFRGITIGRELESAFAHFHSSFTLFRPFNPINLISISHQDKYKYSPNYLSDYFPYYPFGYKNLFSYKLEKFIHPKIIYYTFKIKNKYFNNI